MPGPTAAFASSIDDNPRDSISVRGYELDRNVTATGQIAVEETIARPAVVRGPLSANRFLLHVYLRRTGPGQDTFVTSAAWGPFCPWTISNST